MDNEKAVWFPDEDYIKNTRMYKWMQRLKIKDYDVFYEKSVDDIAWFWEEAVKELDVQWSIPYQKTLDLNKGIKYPAWFKDGKMNIIDNVLEKWASNPSTKQNKAILWEGEDGSKASYTFAELSTAVSSAASGLAKIGVKKGDVVALYMPMLPETVIAMLAIGKMGAILSPAFSGYGAEAVAARLNGAGAKYIITCDGYFRRGKPIPMKKECDRAVEKSPTIEKVIVVRRTGAEIPWKEDRDIEWSEVTRNESTFNSEVTNSDDPLMLIYTSGTTGKPKGTVHTHAGFPIKAAFDAGICMDVNQGDTFFWFTDMGWMMGPFLVFGGLMNGATILLYEGTPDFPNPDRLWELVSTYSVTHLGISPTLIRSLMKYSSTWVHKHDLSSLRVISSSGEPWNPDPWHWLFEEVGKKKLPIINYSGGTEISGGILGNVLLKPISPITFNSALPGMDAHVLDELGNPLIGQVGELVLAKPWVGMTNGFWKDNQRYEDTYWNRYTDMWVHGDWAKQDQEGYWAITGRSDDLLNVAGKRLGPAEMESALVQHKHVLEAATIGIPDEVKGEVAICFVVLVPQAEFNEKLKQELLLLIEKSLGKSLRPKEIYPVMDLVKTRNGKVMRRVIKAAYLNQPTGDLTSLENPEALKSIQSLKSQMHP